MEVGVSSGASGKEVDEEGSDDGFYDSLDRRIGRLGIDAGQDGDAWSADDVDRSAAGQDFARAWKLFGPDSQKYQKEV